MMEDDQLNIIKFFFFWWVKWGVKGVWEKDPSAHFYIKK